MAGTKYKCCERKPPGGLDHVRTSTDENPGERPCLGALKKGWDKPWNRLQDAFSKAKVNQVTDSSAVGTTLDEAPTIN